jgi:hypothetical protein
LYRSALIGWRIVEANVGRTFTRLTHGVRHLQSAEKILVSRAHWIAEENGSVEHNACHYSEYSGLNRGGIPLNT